MGASSPSTVTQTNKVELGPEQKKLFNLTYPKVEALANTPTQVYQGSSVADFSPAQLEAQAQAMNSAAGGKALAEKSAGTQSMLLDPDFMLNPNQYVTGAIDRLKNESNENLLESVLPALRSGTEAQGGPYAGGQTRSGVAQGVAAGKSQGNLSDSIASLLLQNYTQGLTGLGDAVKNTGTVQAQQLFSPQVLSAVGGQQQNMSQQQLNDIINRFYSEQTAPWLDASNLMSFVSGMPGASGVSTVQGAQPNSNPLMQIAGLGMSLLGLPGGSLGAGMFGK